MKTDEKLGHPYIYSGLLQKIIKVEENYLEEIRNRAEFFGGGWIKEFDQYTKMYSLISVGVLPKALFGLFLYRKKKMGYTIEFEFEDSQQLLYFSFIDFKWRASRVSEPDILIRAKFSDLVERSFYIKYFGVIPSILAFIDLIRGTVRIENKWKFFKLLLGDCSLPKGILKSLLGCDIRLGVIALTDEELIDMSLRRIKDKKNALIMDAGCGSGYFARKIMAYGVSVVGMDILSSELKKIQNPEIPRVVADLIYSPFKSHSFDAVFLLEVIEHFDDAWGGRLLDEVLRSLKKGGILVISTPNPATPCQKILKKVEGVPKGDSIIWPLHRKEYPVAELKRLLAKQGFQIRSVIGRHDFDVPHSILLHPLRNHLKGVVRRYPNLSYDYVIIAVKS